jgi:hypothetical protein
VFAIFALEEVFLRKRPEFFLFSVLFETKEETVTRKPCSDSFIRESFFWIRVQMESSVQKRKKTAQVKAHKAGYCRILF